MASAKTQANLGQGWGQGWMAQVPCKLLFHAFHHRNLDACALLPRMTLRRFAQAGSGPAQLRLWSCSPSHPADRTVAEPGTHPTTICQLLTSDKRRIGRTV